MVRDAHWWALEATALMEENIEHLSCSISHRQSGSCRQSRNCRCRSWSVGHPSQAPQAESHWEDPVRWAKSPSPARTRWQVTFEESSLESSPERYMAVKELLPSTMATEDMSSWSQLVEGDLGCPPPLTHCWRTSLEGRCPYLEQKGEMVFGRNYHLNTLSIITLNGLCGKLTRLTLWPGGQGCLWSPETDM